MVTKNLNPVSNAEEALVLLNKLKENANCLNYISLYHQTNHKYPNHDNGRPNHQETLESLINFIEQIMEEEPQPPSSNSVCIIS